MKRQKALDEVIELRRDIGQVRGLLDRGPATDDKHHQQVMLLQWQLRLDSIFSLVATLKEA